MAYNADKLSKNPERERGKEGGRGARESAWERERANASKRASERARETEGRKMCVSVRIHGYQREYVYTYVYMYVYIYKRTNEKIRDKINEALPVAPGERNVSCRNAKQPFPTCLYHVWVYTAWVRDNTQTQGSGMLAVGMRQSPSLLFCIICVHSVCERDNTQTQVDRQFEEQSEL